MGSVLKACDAFVIAVRAVAVRPGTIRSREDGRSPNQVLRLRQDVVRAGQQRIALFAGISRQDRRQIVSDLDQVHSGTALKVPLADLSESKQKVRSALNRATRKNGRKVATASDDTFLYVWDDDGESR